MDMRSVGARVGLWPSCRALYGLVSGTEEDIDRISRTTSKVEVGKHIVNANGINSPWCFADVNHLVL